MCECNEQRNTASQASRRQFLRFGGGAALLTAGAMMLPAMPAIAAPKDGPLPKPQNDLTPDLALSRLMDGNQRYVEGVARRHDFLSEREALASGQNPFAAILSCADSRIAPEYAFDSARGDIFAVRVAGNFVTTDGLASLEYAVAVLGTPVIMVLGHEACGAVKAGVQRATDGTTFPGHIDTLAKAVEPSVKTVMGKSGNVLDNAIRQNVLDNVERLKGASAVLTEALAAKRLKIVGGVYELASGKVQLLG